MTSPSAQPPYPGVLSLHSPLPLSPVPEVATRSSGRSIAVCDINSVALEVDLGVEFYPLLAMVFARKAK